MAGLYEGGSEPAGFLKAILKREPARGFGAVECVGASVSIGHVRAELEPGPGRSLPRPSLRASERTNRAMHERDAVLNLTWPNVIKAARIRREGNTNKT
ncbi:hypothetical protein ANN_18800 [Periplaneta americana]|uniref:Uncharacterized protein n=1 Tax=Periplaneta americana TaxID=6978 RepID=A0ABQ8SRW5_PERAM|nr:hypothetical protein ANN_18800 [Periplaneta americana]